MSKVGQVERDHAIDLLAELYRGLPRGQRSQVMDKISELIVFVSQACPKNQPRQQQEHGYAEDMAPFLCVGVGEETPDAH